MTNAQLKKWFEENHLDGDEIQRGQMLSSQAVLDILIQYQSEVVEKVEELYPEKKTNRYWSTRGVLPATIYKEALSDFIKSLQEKS